MKNKTKYMDLDALVLDMESKDNKFKKIFGSFQIIYIVFIFLYAGIFLFNHNPEERIAGVFYVFAFTLFAIYFRKYYKKYKEVNYADSIKKVLTDAVMRYSLFNPDSIIVFVGALCIDVATVLMVKEDMSEFGGVWGIQIMFFSIISIGIIIGYFWWRRDSRPIWLSAKKILKELEE